MDNALEQIKLISSICDLHIMIELSPDSLKSTIVDFTTIKIKNNLNSLKSIVNEEDLTRLEAYIDNISAISYVYYPSKSIIGVENWASLKMLLSFLNSNNFDFIHFDTISARFLPLLPLIANKRIVATIHDPIPHAGEKSFKKTLISWIYSKFIDEYIFYSIFARNQFLSVRPALHNKTKVLKLLPYTYINSFTKTNTKLEKYILYFGRISPYKGVDLLINVADYIMQYYPAIKIYIAGKSHGDYRLDIAGKANIKLINSYLSINELAELIKYSLFVVCPYKEATQSGVLMTAFAMKKPVLATSVGAFNEYVKEDVNGILVDASVSGIQNGIKKMLTNNYYLNLAATIEQESSELEHQNNYAKYKQIYCSKI